MARPSKMTVEYFSHDCEHGKTIYILEQKYGNDGYAFWFKLLEHLGATSGHVFSTKTPAELEFLSAKAHLSQEKCIEILDLLSKLGAIDAKLWSTGVIWCQNFIDRLSSVYEKRHTSLPIKPDCLPENIPIAPISEKKTPQSKVKYSKVKKTYTIDFESFWLAYPVKIGKDAAYKSWNKLPSGILPDILKTLGWQIKSERWTKDGGQYIPNPTTYLNQGRWKDEPQLANIKSEFVS